MLRDLIVTLKHQRRDELTAPLGELLLHAWHRAGWPPPDLVTAVPVPLLRRLRRGFNQAELLARHVASALGRPYRETLRRRGNARQVGRSRAQRLALGAHTFVARARIAGEVLLVDDVLTTGATAAACTTALRHAGAHGVRVLTLARTPRPGRIP